MSTKIYNGYKLSKKPKNLKEVRDVIFKFRERAIEYYKEKFLKLLAQDFIDIMDEVYLENKTDYVFITEYLKEKKTAIDIIEDDSPYCDHYLIGDIATSIIEKGDIYDKQRSRCHGYWRYASSCELTILPCEDEVFILLYDEDKEISKLLAGTEGIEDYYYWDNTDPPDEIAWEEWEKRGEEWDKALCLDVPSLSGFNIKIVNGFQRIFWEITNYFSDKEAVEAYYNKILENIPDIDSRVSYFAKNALYKEWLQGHKDLRDKTSESNSMSEFLEVEREFRAEIKENPEKLIAKKEELKQKVQQSFTVGDLKRKLKDIYQERNISIEEKKIEE